MKRNEIIFFISFAYLENYYVAYKYLISRISKNFQNIYFVNCENLKLFFRNKKFEKKILLKFPKKIKFVNPKNFKDFEFFLKKKIH